MKELFDVLERVSPKCEMDYLIDTCFFIWVFEHEKVKELSELAQEKKCGLTSFTVEEFVHIDHKIDESVRQAARRFLHKECGIVVVDVPVHPGDAAGEHSFVRKVLPELDSVEHDPSDAVILAAAITMGADVLTRDKHDLFNVRLENFLKKYGVRVLNTFEK
jgi:predicted nucleic acid-binding protein